MRNKKFIKINSDIIKSLRKRAALSISGWVASGMLELFYSRYESNVTFIAYVLYLMFIAFGCYAVLNLIGILMPRFSRRIYKLGIH